MTFRDFRYFRVFRVFPDFLIASNADCRYLLEAALNPRSSYISVSAGFGQSTFHFLFYLAGVFLLTQYGFLHNMLLCKVSMLKNSSGN